MAVNSKYLRIAGEQRRMEFIQFAPVSHVEWISHCAEVKPIWREKSRCPHEFDTGRKPDDGGTTEGRWSYRPFVRQIRRWENPEGAPNKCLLRVEIVLNSESVGLLRAG
ncbi:hypothetical protein B0H14DRAFT_2601287 [Mycena olivaceomarginata]|nr:hypothetical protein B0H14DRAFT_2601287 [Mycena olivaceomarginata]